MKKVFSVVINVLAVVGMFFLMYRCMVHDSKQYIQSHSQVQR